MAKAPVRLLNAAEAFHSKRRQSLQTPATVGDFWRWAFSQLADNTTRGVLAEFIVAMALGIDLSQPRDAWADCDLVTPEGIRIEVKATGYLQAWETRESVPKFTRLRGQKLSADKASYSGNRVVRADVFVFCVQSERNPAKYDPLDLGQWEYWIMPAANIVALNQDSIALSRVQKLAERADFSDLGLSIKRIAQNKT